MIKAIWLVGAATLAIGVHGEHGRRVAVGAPR